jgi:CRP/FNR family transcriptional regulator, anaerobic regulatory protein
MHSISPCVACPIHTEGFCGALLGREEDLATEGTANWQRHLLIAAGKPILLPDQLSEDVYVLCNGWGFRFLQSASGRRQILNFLLPGDLFSASSVFEERMYFSVNALTAVQVSRMRRAEVKSRLGTNPAIVAALAKTCFLEARASYKLIAALGHQSAEERIAFLFLHLMERIAARNVIRDNRYPLPLRQQHIADAVGLTPVHVSRVLGVFRDRGIADLSNGVLEVRDHGDLQRLGSLADAGCQSRSW